MNYHQIPLLSRTLFILLIFKNTVDSRYLEIKGALINTSRYPRFVVLRKKQLEEPNFTNDYVIGLITLEIYIENIVEICGIFPQIL